MSVRVCECVCMCVYDFPSVCMCVCVCLCVCVCERYIQHLRIRKYQRISKFDKQGLFCHALVLRSKLVKLVIRRLASNSNKNNKLNLFSKFRWKAKWSICKSVKTVFL